MSTITAEGLRNEHWRRVLASGTRVDARYARLYCTKALTEDSRMQTVLAILLAGPEQSDDATDPWGDRSFRKAVVQGETYFLKVDAYSSEGDLEFGSDAPEDDEKTVRIFTAMKASDY